MIKRIYFLCIFVLLFFLSSCVDSSGEHELDELETTNTFSEEVKCKLLDGSTKSLSLNKLCDEEDNPNYDNYNYISFHPLKEIANYHFDNVYFDIYTSNEYTNKEFVLKITITDLIIEYETITEEIVNEDGSISTITKEVEKSRHEEVIVVNNDGGKYISEGTEGIGLYEDLDYDINRYSSSTAFKFELYEEDGTTKFSGEWAIDRLIFTVYDIDDYE